MIKCVYYVDNKHKCNKEAVYKSSAFPGDNFYCKKHGIPGFDEPLELEDYVKEKCISSLE